MDDIIRIDENFPDCTAIVTDVWLERVLGEPIDLSQEAFEHLAPGDWLMRRVNTIKGMIEDHEGREYRVTEVQNTYNSENDFSDDFQFAVFWPPSDHDDWIYADDVYVAVEPHLGGDPRGNYGNIRIYKSGDLADRGFFDWCLGWYVVYTDTGEPVQENERFSVGYSNHPYSEMEKHLAPPEGKTYPELKWNEASQMLESLYRDGRVVAMQPYVNV